MPQRQDVLKQAHSNNRAHDGLGFKLTDPIFNVSFPPLSVRSRALCASQYHAKGDPRQRYRAGSHPSGRGSASGCNPTRAFRIGAGEQAVFALAGGTRFARCALLICLIFIEPLFAQQAKPNYPAGVIGTIQVTGNQLYSTPSILKVLGLKPGDRATVPVFEQARQKLQSIDLFDTVSFKFKYESGDLAQYDVLYSVAEDKQVYPLHFERLGADPEAIRAYLKEHVPFYSDRIPGTASVVNRYKSAVQDFLAQSSKDPIRVRATVATDENSKLQVNFFPDAPIPTISLVDVTGNEAVDKGVILRAVNDVAIGTPLTDARIKLILDGAIKPVYAERGYPLVTFPKVETVPSKTNSGVILKVTINDGPRFNFGPLRFRGKGLEEDEIRSALTFKPGDVYNSDKVENFRIELLKKLKRKGLLDATVYPETHPDEAKHIMDVVYNVVPGEPYKFQKLDIQGLDMSSQPVIEKLWGEKPGQTFNPEYPDFFLKKVQERGLFDNLANTQSDYTADADTHTVVVHLSFKGGESADENKRKAREEEEKRQGGGIPPNDE
jgi:outer membrane protein insertion porin family